MDSQLDGFRGGRRPAALRFPPFNVYKDEQEDLSKTFVGHGVNFRQDGCGQAGVATHMSFT